MNYLTAKQGPDHQFIEKRNTLKQKEKVKTNKIKSCEKLKDNRYGDTLRKCTRQWTMC